jgi:signal transduction histidine kinase
VVLLLVLGAGVILLRGLQRWLAQPLAKIGHSIAVIGAGNLDHRVPVAAPDELSLIASEINRMSAALGESQARLVESQRLAAVGELSSYVAHNIRNPLAGMRSAAQLGLADADDAQASRKVLHDIIGAVDRLEAWVRQLLVYSAPLDLARVPHDINGMLRDVLALLRPSLDAKRLRLALDLTPELPALSLDEQHLEQAFAALVSNAVDACPAGGRLTVSTRRTDGGIGIVVKDSGGGMPPEVLQKAFQPYFTTKPTGVGLGLVMARRMIEAHGGRIEIASAAGVGTTVTIRLPE